MWSEDFDKKAQDAASNHSPAYDDKSWDKMESLLDKHLPVEKKKRRFIFWLILPVLVGICTYLMLRTNNTNNADGTNDAKVTKSATGVTASSETSDKQASKIATPNQKDNSSTASAKNTVSVDTHDQPNPENLNEPILSKETNAPITGNSSAIKRKNPSSDKSITSKGQGKKSNSSVETFSGDPVTSKDDKNINGAITLTAIASSTPASDDKTIAADDKKIDVTQPATVSKDSASAIADSAITASATPSKKPKKSSSKGFIAGLSLGPDISGLGMNTAGTVKMQYGLTLGYAFSDRLIVRTGFFTSRKVYTADPSEYHPPYNFWIYYPKIEKIDANCLVYEIPITAVYTFPSSKKHNWFVSTGLSSYIMKDETYDYYYKNVWGQTETRTRTISNENSHLFSVINISGGYKRNLSKNFFLTAEPYLKLPVSGVGYGNVKLNSGGLLFTIGSKF